MFRKTLFLLLITSAITAAGAEKGRVLELTLGRAIGMALEKNFSIAVQKFEPVNDRFIETTAWATSFDSQWKLPK